MTLTYIRPDADDTDGTWTNEADSGSNLFASIDETSANDSDYIKSAHLPDHDICKIRLSDPSGMVMRPATVHYRFKKKGEASTQINLDVSLLQGATEIAKWTESDIGTSYVDGSQALDVTQFNSISDFTNLYLQFDAYSAWWLAGSSVDLDFDSGLYYDSSYATATDSANLLLHMDGADASTTFIDATGRHQVTVQGDAQVDTAQSKFGGASALFDGTGDSLRVAIDTDCAFGTGDYTIDFWIRPNAFSGGANNIVMDADASGRTILIYIEATTHKVVFQYDSTGTSLTSTTALSTGTWYHVATTRSGTSLRLFINGTQEGGTATDSGNYSATPTLYIGQQGSDISPRFNGWLDELRVLKGTAAWTTTFTPPTAPYNVALSGPYAHLSCSRASIGYATTSSGTLTQFASNALRITDLGLLVEDARTNLCLQSADLTTTWANHTGVTFTANATTAPDGTTTADKITPSGSVNPSGAYQAITGSGQGTWSVYAKNAGYNFAALTAVATSGAVRYSIVANLTTGAITATNTIGSPTGIVTSVETLANGWFRLIITINETASELSVSVSDVATPNFDGNGFVSMTGDGSSGVYFWGAQQESGAFPSSYIPTTSAAATRAADLVTIVGNLNTTIIGDPRSIMVDLITPVTPSDYWRIIGDVGISEDLFECNSGNNVTVRWHDGTGLQANLGNSLTMSGGVKVANSQSSTARSLVGGGGTVATDSNGVTGVVLNPLLGRGEGASKGYFIFRRLTVWNSKLADATLQGFTNP